MSIARVRACFETLGIADRILEFPVSSATVALAAQALHCAPERIAKTLSFLVDDHAVLIVAAGDARVDNKRFKAYFHQKAKMLSPEEAEKMVGHAVGGICPFAVNTGAEIYLDVSLRRFATVYPACGSSNSAIEMTMEELEKYTNFVDWIDVCKDWREVGE